MPMTTNKNKTKQCPQEGRDPPDHTPPRFRTGEQSFRFQLASRRRAIQKYSPLDSVYLGHFFPRLRLHVSASTGC